MSWWRLFFVLLSLIGCAAITYFAPNAIGGSPDADDAIVELFAVLAAVLLAIISIIGDPSMLLPGNWRIGHEHAKEVQNKLARYSHVFLLYLLIIGLVILRKSLGYDSEISTSMVAPAVTFTALLGFLWSLPLPYKLMAIQKQRMTEAVKARREGTAK